MEHNSNNFYPYEEQQPDKYQAPEEQTFPAPHQGKNSLSSEVGTEHENILRRPIVKTRTVRVIKSTIGTRSPKKAWYTQGWIWLIVAVAAIAAIWFGLSGLTEQAAHINDSLHEQTGVLRVQNNILKGIAGEIVKMNRDINQDFDRLMTMAREAMNHFGID